MLVNREKRFIALVFKGALLILVGTALFMPELDVGPSPLVAMAETAKPPA